MLPFLLFNLPVPFSPCLKCKGPLYLDYNNLLSVPSTLFSSSVCAVAPYFFCLPSALMTVSYWQWTWIIPRIKEIQPQLGVPETKDVTRDLWPLPLGRCLKSQRRCSPQQAPEGPVTQDLCPWLWTPLPLNQLNHRPGVGGLSVLLQSPYSPLHYFCGIKSSVCFPGPPARLGLMTGYCISVSSTKTCTFRHSACVH